MGASSFSRGSASADRAPALSAGIDVPAAGRTPAETTLFFSLLVAVTALPLLLFPFATHVAPSGTRLVEATTLLLFLGSQAHVAASFFFYGEPRARAFMLGERRARFLYVPVAIVALSAAVVYGLGEGVLLSYFVLGYWVWQTHHYTRQNHGILAFVSRAEATPVTFAERTAITLSGVAAVLGMITIVTPFQATVFRRYAWHLETTALCVYVVAWGFYLASLRRGAQPGLRRLVNATLMAFYLPVLLFTDPLSAFFTYAIAHGLQYLVFMYFVAASPQATRRAMLAALAVFALGGGAVLKLMDQSHAIFGGYHGAVFGAGLGIVMWHFVLDAGMWRLSEPFQRGYMAERFSFLRAR